MSDSILKSFIGELIIEGRSFSLLNVLDLDTKKTRKVSHFGSKREKIETVTGALTASCELTAEKLTAEVSLQ